MKNVLVAGGGTLGSQIAYQSAYFGKQVTVYDVSDAAITAAEKKIDGWDASYRTDMHATDDQINVAHANLTFSTDLAEAVNGKDIVIEAVPENLDIKKSFYKELSAVAAPETIFASNSSTMTTSELNGFTDRPDKFLNLHFANQIWVQNTAEIMVSDKTDPDVEKAVVAFAREIGMVPIVMQKEQHGYVLNALLGPFTNAALALWGNGVADPQTIDKTWMIATGAPRGAFAIMDEIGLPSLHTILSNGRTDDVPDGFDAGLDKIQQMVDEGYKGQENGKGFYNYPNPAYESKDFLK
ncbi:3-hydroxybutyryl-CoA dehydrogenase [Weissella viridescens]|nr:3-hydroxybutyryl-CoA dehydrogenase [Weissella viridescens]